MNGNAAKLSLLGLFFVLGLATPPSGPARRARPHVPDWRIVYEEGDPPLTFSRIETAVREASYGPLLEDLRVTSSPWEAGDRRLLTTVSPNGDGVRDKAVVRFELDQPTTVTMTVMACSKHSQVISAETDHLPAGNE